MSKYLPEFLLNEPRIKALHDLAITEVGILRADIDDLIDQCFVDTATWGLSYWERFVGLPVDNSKPIVERREQIKAKVRGSGTATKALVKSIAEAFAGEVEIIEDFANSSFTIKFVGTRGIPKNMGDFMAQIRAIKPAHLGVLYEYTYLTFQELGRATWGQVSEMTWEELSVARF